MIRKITLFLFATGMIPIVSKAGKNDYIRATEKTLEQKQVDRDNRNARAEQRALRNMQPPVVKQQQNIEQLQSESLSSQESSSDDGLLTNSNASQNLQENAQDVFRNVPSEKKKRYSKSSLDQDQLTKKGKDKLQIKDDSTTIDDSMEANNSLIEKNKKKTIKDERNNIIAQLTARIEELEKEIEKVEQERDDEADAAIHHRNYWHEEEEKVKALEAHLRNARRNADLNLEGLNKYRDANKSLEQQMKELQQGLQKITQEKHDQDDAINFYQKELEKEKEKHQEDISLLSELAEQIKGHKRLINEGRDKEKAAQTTIAGLQKQNQDHQTLIGNLRQANSALERQRQALQDQIEKLKRDDLAQIEQLKEQLKKSMAQLDEYKNFKISPVTFTKGKTFEEVKNQQEYYEKNPQVIERYNAIPRAEKIKRLLRK